MGRAFHDSLISFDKAQNVNVAVSLAISRTAVILSKD
jgi:hypothetical protein